MPDIYSEPFFALHITTTNYLHMYIFSLVYMVTQSNARASTNITESFYIHICKHTHPHTHTCITQFSVYENFPSAKSKRHNLFLTKFFSSSIAIVKAACTFHFLFYFPSKEKKRKNSIIFCTKIKKIFKAHTFSSIPVET